MTDPTLDDVKLAALVAAVAAHMDRELGAVRLRAVEPVPAGPSPWVLAARLHQMDGRRLLVSRRNGR